MCGDTSSGERPEVLIQESAPRPTALGMTLIVVVQVQLMDNGQFSWLPSAVRAGPPPPMRGMDMRGGPAPESWSASSEIWLALGTPMHLLLLSGAVISVGKSWARAGSVTLFVLQLLWSIGSGSNFWLVSAPAQLSWKIVTGGFPLPNGK